MVSVAAFKFSQVGFVMQSQLSTCLIMKCDNVETKEESAISWENFQNVFTSRSRNWKLEKTSLSKNDTIFSLRITKDASPTTPGVVPDPGYLSVLATNLHIPLLMSSVSGLVDFFEDEMSAKPIPSKVILSNLRVQLKDDGPPMGLSPNSMPLTISLPGCIIERSLTGTLNVLPLPERYIIENMNLLLNQVPNKVNVLSGVSCLAKDDFDVGRPSDTDGNWNANHRDNFLSESLQYSCDIPSSEIPSLLKILKENEELKSKVLQMTQLQRENEQLREEVRTLKRAAYAESATRVTESKTEIKNLEDKKRTLQETLSCLQSEISRLETKRKSYTDG